VAVWTLGGVGFALARDYSTLMAARMVLGVGQAAFAPAALIVLGSGAVAIGRARAVSMFTTGSAIGRSGGLFLGGAVMLMVGGGTVLGLAPWRAASLALVVPNLALIVGLLVLARRGGASAPEPSSGLNDALVWVVGRGRAVLSLFVAGAGSVLIVQSAGAWLPSIVHRQFGLPAADAAMLVGMTVLVAAPTGHLSAGWILGRAGERRLGPAVVLIAGLVLSVLAAMALLAAPSLITAVIALGLFVGGSGLAAAAALIALQPMTPDRLRGGVNALFLAGVSVVGVGLGPWVTGALSDHHVSSQTGLTLALVQVAAAVGAVLIPVALWSGRRWSDPVAD
jgi:MFS family permease